MSSDDQLKAVRTQCENLRNTLEDMRSQTRPKILQDVAQKDAPTFNPQRRKVLQGHFGKVYSLSWHSNDLDVVSASQDGKLMVWNTVTSNKKLAIPLRSAWVMTCAYSPSGEFVACGGLDNLCSIFRMSADSVGWEAKQAYRELQQHEGYLSCCRFLNNDQIITSSGDSTCILWDIQTKQPKATFMDHTGDVMSVAPNKQNENMFVSGSTDASAKVWDIRTEKCVGNFTGHESDINSVQWFPDGFAFASGSDDASARLFDVRAYRQLNQYSSGNIYCGVTSLDFSKSGQYLFAGYDDDPFCCMWSTTKGIVMEEMKHEQRVSCLQVSTSGNAVATGCWDCNLRIWA